MSNAKKILLVEDNPDDRDLAMRALQKYGAQLEIITATDGEAALTYLFGAMEQLPPALPDLVLLDLKLPKYDGFDVLQRIRAEPRTRVLPVVMLTSSSETSDVRTSYECGANSYLRKPVDFLAFTEAMKTLSVYWLTLNTGVPA